MSNERFEPRPPYENEIRGRVANVVERLQARPLAEGGDVAALEKRKEYIERILTKIGENAPALLDAFNDIVQRHLGQRISLKELSLFVVGGNAHGGVFKETSDVDLVFAASPALNPLAENAVLSYPERHAIGKELYEAIYTLFSDDIATGAFKKEDLEIKGFGNQTPDELRTREEKEKDAVRLLSKIWPD